MWLKFLSAALVILFCILLGYLAAGKYRARKQFYGQFARFNERFLSELNYGRKPLSSFLEENTEHDDFGKAVKDFSGSGNIVGLRYLKKEEQAEAENYFSMLGKGDARSQKEFFSAQSRTLEEKKQSSEQEAKMRSELYLKLGLIAGLAIVILIV